MADWESLAPRAKVTAFQDHLDDEDALVERLHSFDIVMLMRERTHMPRTLIERLPNLKLLNTAMWNASDDIDAATERGIQVCGSNDLGMHAAEMAVGLMLALARSIAPEDRAIGAEEWQTTLG